MELSKLLCRQAGQTVRLRPDCFLITDGPSHVCVEQIGAVADPERLWLAHDHNVPTGAPEDARVFKLLQNFYRAHGGHFLCGRGVALRVLADEVLRPGQIAATASRFAGTLGAAGCLGLRLSPAQLANAVESGEVELTLPASVQLRFVGRLPAGVSATGAARCLLGRLREPLRGQLVWVQGLEGDMLRDFCTVLSLSDAFAVVAGQAEDAAVLEVDLSSLSEAVLLPCAARADQPEAEVTPLRAVRDVKFDAGQIGGLCDGGIESLRRVAAQLRGKRLRPRFRLSIVPATAQDYLLAAREGLWEQFIDFGAQIMAVGDRSCITQGAGVVGSGEALLTTGLYTFDGCMGMKDAAVYSASAQAVAAAACGEELA